MRQFLGIGILIMVLWSHTWATITLVRHSVNTITYVGQNSNITAVLGDVVPSGLMLLRVAFRQYANPYANTNTTLMLDNRLTETADQMAKVYDDILVYPNPFRLRTGALMTYHLNGAVSFSIHIYNMFGRHVFKQAFVAGMAGAQMGINRLELNSQLFNYYDAPSGPYFVIMVDEKGHVMKRSKFVIVP
jgi:hypothetical protein